MDDQIKITLDQAKALYHLWRRFHCDDDGRSKAGFGGIVEFDTVLANVYPVLAGDGAIAVPMGTALHVCIEPDGHTHS